MPTCWAPWCPGPVRQSVLGPQLDPSSKTPCLSPTALGDKVPPTWGTRFTTPCLHFKGSRHLYTIRHRVSCPELWPSGSICNKLLFLNSLMMREDLTGFTIRQLSPINRESQGLVGPPPGQPPPWAPPSVPPTQSRTLWKVPETQRPWKSSLEGQSCRGQEQAVLGVGA